MDKRTLELRVALTLAELVDKTPEPNLWIPGDISAHMGKGN
ncbi:MAG: hypothetical protein WCB92_04630 [Mycobacterium sp.]